MTAPTDIAAWVRNAGVWKRTKPQVRPSGVWLHVVTNQVNVSTVWKFAMCDAVNAIQNPSNISLSSFDASSPYDVGVGYRYNLDGTTDSYSKPGSSAFAQSTTPWLKYDTTWWTYRITWNDAGSHNLDTVPVDLTDVLLGAIVYTFETNRSVVGTEAGTFSTIITDNDAGGPAPTIASYNLALDAEAGLL